MRMVVRRKSQKPGQEKETGGGGGGSGGGETQYSIFMNAERKKVFVPLNWAVMKIRVFYIFAPEGAANEEKMGGERKR